MKNNTSLIPGHFAAWNVTPFDNLFDRFFAREFPELTKTFDISFAKGSYPKVDIISYKDKIVVEAEVYGHPKDDVTVEIAPGVLTIKGKAGYSEPLAEDAKVIHSEIKRSSFSRTFSLSNDLDTEKATAEYKDGIVKVTLPRVKIKEPEVKKLL